MKGKQTLTWSFIFDDFWGEERLEVGFAEEVAFVALICVYSQLFAAFGAPETIFVPDGLLRLDLFHLEDLLVASPAVATVRIGPLKQNNIYFFINFYFSISFK